MLDWSFIIWKHFIVIYLEQISTSFTIIDPCSGQAVMLQSPNGFPIASAISHDKHLLALSRNLIFSFNGKTWTTIPCQFNPLKLCSSRNRLFALGGDKCSLNLRECVEGIWIILVENVPVLFDRNLILIECENFIFAGHANFMYKFYLDTQTFIKIEYNVFEPLGFFPEFSFLVIDETRKIKKMNSVNGTITRDSQFEEIFPFEVRRMQQISIRAHFSN